MTTAETGPCARSRGDAPNADAPNADAVAAGAVAADAVAADALNADALDGDGFEELFRLEEVRFAYPGHSESLAGINLSIRRGERVALLGANGSGKSTLLRILNALAHPTSGRFTAYGDNLDERALRDPATSWRFRRRVGFLFQNTDAQLFSSTIREDIAFGPMQLGLTDAEVEQRVSDVASLLDIGHLLDRAPFRLSGGEKKKAALAGVLATGPETLLLDEPGSGLDPRSQRWLVDFLGKLHRAGKTLVLATHDLTAVAELADRAIVLNEQHGIEADGPVSDVLRDHALLTRVNLIHEHLHWHGTYCHSHAHTHGGEHDHDHGIDHYHPRGHVP